MPKAAKTENIHQINLLFLDLKKRFIKEMNKPITKPETKEIAISINGFNNMLYKERFPPATAKAIWNNIANRLYYAAFHAVSALLIHDHYNVGSHQGAVIMLHQYYVKPGILSKEDGAFYSQLQTMREKSDYNCTYNATEEEIVPRIAQTKQFIDKILMLIH